MANFSSLSQLLNTTDGMTILRNNSAQDDGVDTITGVDWFTFNGIVASKIYVSGNSFVGFGSNAEHLKICRRDGKMWYLYRQEGTIGNSQFLKIRWEGYTRYNYTSSAYALVWELFLFVDGGLYLNVVTVPSNSSYLGSNQLVCGSNTYGFTMTASTPVGYSFLPDGFGKFVLSEEEYPILVNHVSFGFIEFSTQIIQNIDTLAGSKIIWTENLPEGTSLSVYSRVSSGSYGLCTSGGSLFGVTPGANYSSEILFIKVEMSTTDPSLTPTLSDLFIQLLAPGDDHVLILSFDPGNINNIQNAVGEVEVAYDGSGTLKGLGGPILSFDQTFTPVGLNPKNNPHYIEHIEVMNAVATGRLLQIHYRDIDSYAENITLSDVSAIGTLQHIDDI